MRLRQKNFLFVSFVILLVMTLSFGVLYLTMPRFYTQFKRNQIEAEVQNLQTELSGLPQTEILKRIEQTEKNKQSSSFWVVLNNDWEVLYVNPVGFVTFSSDSQQSLADFAESSEGSVKFNTGAALSERSNEFVKFTVKIPTKQKDDLYLMSLAALQPISEAKTVLIRMYPLFLVAALLIGGIGAFIYSNFSTKRLRRLSRNTRELMTLNPKAVPLQDSGRDEIGELSADIETLYRSLVTTIEELNTQMNLIQEKEQEKTAFMRIAAHELKTPLTSMTGIVEGMLYNVGEFKDHEAYLGVCLNILEEQRQLVSDLLSVAKEDHLKQQSTDVTPLFLDEFLLEMLQEKFILQCENKGLFLEYHLERQKIVTDPRDLRKIFNNSLENALKYTAAGGKIVVRLKNQQVEIINQCQPLAEKDLARIFEPFYRPDYARNREDGGSGLGLYIVKQLTQRQGIVCQFQPYPAMHQGLGAVEQFQGMRLTFDFTKLAAVAEGN